MDATTGGVIAAIALALVTWFLGGRNKNSAETTAGITAAAGEMIEQLRQEVQRLVLKVDNLEHDKQVLVAKVDNLEQENRGLRQRVAELEREVRQLESDGR